MTNRLNPKLLLVIGLVAIVLIYIYFSVWSNNGFTISQYARYNMLVDAFLHHRLNVHTFNTKDLSFYHNQLYLYWGPAPVIFIWPFYAVMGMNASDVFYNLLAGILNILLFYLGSR